MSSNKGCAPKEAVSPWQLKTNAIYREINKAAGAW